MATNSMRGESFESRVGELVVRVKQNLSFITLEDIEILEYLANKGDFPEYEIKLVKKDYVPFVDEVEEFNSTFGKPNNYEPTIPEEKEWKLFTTSYSRT